MDSFPNSIIKYISIYNKIDWFEKFDWFISDENYLCVGGKDATQNELLVKNFLSKGDIYIHADVPGASCVIIKNPYTSTNKDLLDEAIKQGIFAKQPEKDECMISGPSLHQAATMSVCHSKAWESKIVTSAW